PMARMAARTLHSCRRSSPPRLRTVSVEKLRARSRSLSGIARRPRFPHSEQRQQNREDHYAPPFLPALREQLLEERLIQNLQVECGADRGDDVVKKPVELRPSVSVVE